MLKFPNVGVNIMPRLNREVLFSPQALWTMTALACTSQVSLVAITVTLATRNVSDDRQIYSVALAASFSDILTFPTAIAIALLRQRRSARRMLFLLGFGSIPLVLTAAVLTMYTLACIYNSADIELRGLDFRMTQAIAESGLAIWVIAIVAQIMLYTVGLWPEESYTTDSPMEEITVRESPSRLVMRSPSARSDSKAAMTSFPDFGSEPEPVSSAFSAYSISPRQSFRNSVHKVIRPVTSRTRLLFHHPFILPDPSVIVPERAASVGAVERNLDVVRCDTPGLGILSHYRLSRKLSKRRLETIPGSRCVSPANPLDGPFPSQLEHPIQFPVTPPSSESSSVRTVIRSRSMSGRKTEQGYIHPLFRSASATPPPVASPGTVITASPFAGQVVSPEHRSMTRWCSSERKRPEMSSPLSASNAENDA